MKKLYSNPIQSKLAALPIYCVLRHLVQEVDPWISRVPSRECIQLRFLPPAKTGVHAHTHICGVIVNQAGDLKCSTSQKDPQLYLISANYLIRQEFLRNRCSPALPTQRVHTRSHTIRLLQNQIYKQFFHSHTFQPL